MSIDRLSELQDLIDKFNVAKPADQKAAMEEIVNFLADDYRQITLLLTSAWILLLVPC